MRNCGVEREREETVMRIKKKVLLVDQIGHKTYEYDYAAAKHYSEDYDVTCYVSDNTPKDVPIEGFKVAYGFHDVYSGSKIAKGLKYIKSLWQLRKYIKYNKIDIVNLQWYDLPPVDRMFIRSVKKLNGGTKVVLTVHGVIPKEINARKHDGLQKVYLEADAILLHSEPALEHFNRCFQTNCKKYVITSAFRDEDDYAPVPKDEARKKLGLPLDKKIVLSFGTLRDDKTIDLLYEAFPKVLEQQPDLFLVSVGTLNVTDKERYIKLAEQCRATGAAKIDFDYVPKDLEPYYYSAADILVLPYSYISQSGVGYCSLLFKVPMVASDIPRLDLMAKKDINAEIFHSGDIDGLTKCIIDLSRDEKKLAKYSEGSQAIRESDFSIKRRVALTEIAYKELYE